MKYEIVYFDLDNTLLDFSKSERESLKNVFERHEVFLSEEEVSIYVEINKKWWKLFSEGKYSKEFIVVARFEEFMNRLGVKLDPNLIAQEYLDSLSKAAHFLPGAEEFLCKLKAANQRMAVLTNGVQKVQEGRFKALRLERFFEFLLTSEAVGYPKPNPAIFFMASQMSKVPLEKSVYVGDDPIVDGLGARNANLTFILFDFYHVHDDYDGTVAKNFEELYNLLI